MQRTDSPHEDGGPAGHCKTKDDVTDRRRGRPDSCFSAHDDPQDSRPQTTSEDEEDFEEQNRLQSEGQGQGQGKGQGLQSSLDEFQDNAHDDAADGRSQMTSEGEEDFEEQGRLQGQGQRLQSSLDEFQDDVRRFSTSMTGAGSTDDNRIAFRGLHPLHLRGICLL